MSTITFSNGEKVSFPDLREPHPHLAHNHVNVVSTFLKDNYGVTVDMNGVVGV